MVCPRCGKDAENNATFCMRCGQRLSDERSPRRRFTLLAVVAFLCGAVPLTVALLLPVVCADLRAGAYSELCRRLWWLWVMPYPGFPIGAMALATSTTRTPRLPGVLLSLGGIVFSALTWPALWVTMPTNEGSRRVHCLANTKNLSLAAQMYAADYGVFPPAEDWADATEDYFSNETILICPDTMRVRDLKKPGDTLVELKAGRRPGSYAYNASLSSLPVDGVAQPRLVVSIFESDAGWNAAGGPELLPKEPRHGGGDNYGFADGGARFRRRETALDPEKGVRWRVEDK